MPGLALVIAKLGGSLIEASLISGASDFIATLLPFGGRAAARRNQSRRNRLRRLGASRISREILA